MSGLVVVVLLVSGMVCGKIAARRGRSFRWYFLLGFLSPLFGLLAALFYNPPPRETRLPRPDEPGYWPDPTGRFDERYYDGHRWTAQVFDHADPRPYDDPM